MARRTKDNAVDWDAIERQYRLGQKSNKQLGEEFDVDGSSIGRRAKARGWVVDKSSEVAAVKSALLIQNASGNANPNATPSALEIKAAGQVAADIVLSHRKGLRKLGHLRDAMMEELSLSCSEEGRESIEQLLALPAGAEADTAKARRLDRVLSLSSRVEDLKKLVEIDERIRRGEREAFSIRDDEDPGAGALVAATLSEAQRASRLAAIIDLARRKRDDADA